MEHCNGTSRGRHTLLPATATSDIQNKMEKMTETLLDLQKAQQNNANSIQCVMLRVESIANDVEKLKKHISKQPQETSLTKASSLPKKRTPNDLSTAVKSIYWSLPENRQFRVEEKYKSPHNQRVTAWLLEEIKKVPRVKQHSEYFTKAIYRYYESRRRKFKDETENRLDVVKINGKNSRKRRFQKKFYEDRRSVLKDDEKPKWDQINHLYMTSESDTELDHQKIKLTHTPTWRSAELNSLIDDLDRRLAGKKVHKENVGFIRKERVAGPPSRSHPPAGAPEWAVNPAHSRQTPEQHTQSSEHPWSSLNSPYSTSSDHTSAATTDDRMMQDEPCQAPAAQSSDALSKTKAASSGLHARQDLSSEDEFSSDSS